MQRFPSCQVGKGAAGGGALGATIGLLLGLGALLTGVAGAIIGGLAEWLACSKICEGEYER